VDQKYLVPWGRFAEIAAPLRDGHQALEIEGERIFRYSSVYFDTPELLCFREHVEDVEPRFKVRTRAYHESGLCSFEVKVKLESGETTKENLDYDLDDHGRITPEARAFVRRVLADAAGREVPGELEPALITRFRRATLGARDGTARITIDVELRLERPDDGAVCMLPDNLVVETKSESGQGLCDDLMRQAGMAPVSLSKYRLGIATLAASDPDPPLGAERDRYLRRC
jgi:VTC domain